MPVAPKFDELNQPRVTVEDIGVMKKFFGNNTKLLMALKNFLHQGEETEADTEALLVLRNDTTGQARRVINKIFLLEKADPRASLFNSIDIYTISLNPNESIDVSYPKLVARKKMFEYLVAQFGELFDGIKNTIAFDNIGEITDDAFDTYVNVYAKNTLLNYIDNNIKQFVVIAGKESETSEEGLKRLILNSTK